MAALSKTAKPFINYIEDWQASLPARALKKVVRVPSCTAVVSVDIINGFCTVGPLSSPRVQGIVKPIVKLMKGAHKLGVPYFVLTQDTHPANAIEFAHYPPHCVRDTIECQTVPEFLKLPFAHQFITIEKNSISSAHSTRFDQWLDGHPEIDTFIVVGDCTDLCTYQLAMHLRLRANAAQHADVRVIVPANCVQTYDTPVKIARKRNIPAHDGDLLHAIFLYNMACNGVDVVARLT